MTIFALMLNVLAVFLMGYCLSFETRKGWRIADWVLLVLNVICIIYNICRLFAPDFLNKLFS